eukprot:g19249.t1
MKPKLNPRRLLWKFEAGTLSLESKCPEAKTFNSFLTFYGIRQEDPRLQHAVTTLGRDSLVLGSPPREQRAAPAGENSLFSFTPLRPRNLSYSSCDTTRLEEAIAQVAAQAFAEKDSSEGPQRPAQPVTVPSVPSLVVVNGVSYTRLQTIGRGGTSKTKTSWPLLAVVAVVACRTDRGACSFFPGVRCASSVVSSAVCSRMARRGSVISLAFVAAAVICALRWSSAAFLPANTATKPMLRAGALASAGAMAAGGALPAMAEEAAEGGGLLDFGKIELGGGFALNLNIPDINLVNISILIAGPGTQRRTSRSSRGTTTRSWIPPRRTLLFGRNRSRNTAPEAVLLPVSGPGFEIESRQEIQSDIEDAIAKYNEATTRLAEAEKNKAQADQVVKEINGSISKDGEG